MRRAIGWMAVLGGLAACGGNAPAGPEDQSNLAASTITIVLDSGRIYDLRAGDRLRLSAVVRDVDFQPLPGARVTWRSGNAGMAQVTAAGIVTIPVNPGSMSTAITATAGHATATFPLTMHDWNYYTGRATLSAVTTGVNAIPLSLDLSCRDGVFSAGLHSGVVTPIGPRLANASVTTEFSGTQPTSIAWQVASDGSKITLPNHATALAFADRMLTADTLRLRYTFTAGGAQESVFDLGRAGNVVGLVTGPCR